VTLGGTIVMGRKTWESLPGKLPGRRSIVMSRSQREDIEVMSYEEVLELCLRETRCLHHRRGRNIPDCSSMTSKSFIGRSYKPRLKALIHSHQTYMDDLGFHLIGERIVEAGEKDQYNMVFQHFIR
jgi:dihydrofolate reductase